MAIDLHKNEVGSYFYNDANMLVTKIEHALAEQLFEDSTDGMKGLLSTAKNTLTDYKAHISIKHKDVIKDSKDTADRLSSSSSSGMTVQPEIATNSDAQEEADRQNTYRLGVEQNGVFTKKLGTDRHAERSRRALTATSSTLGGARLTRRMWQVGEARDERARQ